jgi:cation diffusion facilitator CzcD-associated flavoprotein CzcO
VKDPAVAEKLIPRDHGFGVQRVPMETRYFEAYNRDNVHLVDITETPIERVTETGLRTTERDYDFDIIIYATGFDAITGPFDRIDIQGIGGAKLRDKWSEGPSTFLGMLVHGFPNLFMPAGPRAVLHRRTTRVASRPASAGARSYSSICGTTATSAPNLPSRRKNVGPPT